MLSPKDSPANHRTVKGETMALSDSDLKEIKLYAREAAREIVKETIKEHILSCPHGRTLLVARGMMIGMLLMTGITGGGIGAIITKYLLSH